MIDFGKSLGRRQRRRRQGQQQSQQQNLRRPERQPNALPPDPNLETGTSRLAKPRRSGRLLSPTSATNGSAIVPRPASPLRLSRETATTNSGEPLTPQPRPTLHLTDGRSLPSSANRRGLPTAQPQVPHARRRRSQAARRRHTSSRPLPQPRPSTQQSRNSQRSPLPRSISPLLYGTRLLIVGIGIGVIAGTLLSTWNPASRVTAGSSQTAITAKSLSGGQQAANPKLNAPPMPLKLGSEITTLKSQVQALASSNTGLAPGVFLIDLDSNNYVNLNGTAVFPAASTIKVPVLVAFFQDVDAGKIRLDEQLEMRPELIGSGSGDMQYQPPGTKYSALETAFKMITISDNTATNMLIARLGGAAALNQRFQSWGLTATAIQNPLPDLQGTNTTSPRDLANLMAWVNQGDLVSMRSRDRMLDIMRKTVTDSLLPRGLGEGATIAHKTGDIGTLIGDVGLVDMPSGKRYVIAALVKRPFNDEQGSELIRRISQVTYRALAQPTATNPSTGTTNPALTNPSPGMGATNPTPNNFTNFPGAGQSISPQPNNFNRQ